MAKTVKILSFDPGLSKAGWSVGTYNTETGELIIQNTGTVRCRAAAEKAARRDLVIQYGKRTVALVLLMDELRDLVEKHAPDYIVCEDAFYSKFRPNAYAPLMQWITILRIVSYRYCRRVHAIQARAAKHTVATFGGAGKKEVLAGLHKLENVKWGKRVNLDEISEHEADSCAILFTFCMKSLINNEAVEKDTK